MKKNFMMSMEEFRRAVDSLAGFGGIVGVMGGETDAESAFPREDKVSRGGPSRRPEVLRSVGSW